MQTTRRRVMAAVMATAVLLSFNASAVSALTLQRTWTTKMPASGVNGSISARAYTDGSGSITYSLKGLRANATYSVQIRYGTCAKLGSITLRLPSVKLSSTGTLSRTATIAKGDMYWFWKAARSANFVVRIVNGTTNPSIRCGDFSFAHATRVAISALGINLPVVRGPSGYPYCNVAMYQPALAQPREPGVTFIYGHARTGMFLPLLTRWKADHGASMIGKLVAVYTSDSYLIYYKISRFRVASAYSAMSGATSLTSEKLWLQTSTGPNSTYPKLIVEATRYRTIKTTYAASHPAAHPVSC